MASTKKGWLKTPHGDNFIPKTYATAVYMSDGETTVQDKLNNYTGGSNSGGTGVDTNYYHTPKYTSGIKIGTGAGINDLYVPTGTTANTVATGSHNHDDKYAKISQIAELTDNYYNMYCWHRKGTILDVSSITYELFAYNYTDSDYYNYGYTELATNWRASDGDDVHFYFSNTLDDVLFNQENSYHYKLTIQSESYQNTSAFRWIPYKQNSNGNSISTLTDLITFMQSLITGDNVLYLRKQYDTSDSAEWSLYKLTTPDDLVQMLKLNSAMNLYFESFNIKAQSGSYYMDYIEESTYDDIIYDANKYAHTNSTDYTEESDGLQYKYLGVPKDFVPRKIFNI